MYVRSLATTRIGKNVSGRAIALKTTEYSVSMIGSTVVSSTPIAAIVESRMTVWKRAARNGSTYLPHCQPKY